MRPWRQLLAQVCAASIRHYFPSSAARRRSRLLPTSVFNAQVGNVRLAKRLDPSQMALAPEDHDGDIARGRVSTAETKCAGSRRDSVPVGLREKGCEAPIYFHASMPIHVLVARCSARLLLAKSNAKPISQAQDMLLPKRTMLYRHPHTDPEQTRLLALRARPA